MQDLTGILCVLVLLPFASLSRMHGFKSTPDEAMDLYTKHPDFLPTPKFYTVTVGQTAVLKCAVTNLEGKKVIWKKANDASPLTVDLESFYNTDRIEAEHRPRLHQWNLVIKNARREDSGMYECEVSSQMRNLREHFQLLVNDKEPQTTQAPREGIKVSGSAFVEKGEEIYLICNATGQDHSPSSIDWFINGNKLTSRGKKVEIKDFVAVTSRTVVSVLQVADAQLSDSGNYVCRTSNLHIASFTVAVLNSETSNNKRGTDSGNRNIDSSHGKRDPGRQDGLSSEDKNSAQAHRASKSCHILLCVSAVIALLRHWLFPS